MMKRTLLSAIVVCLGLTATAQPAGGFGGFQVPEANLETSQLWKDVNYAGDDKAYHTCDIYLPKQQRDNYPVVIHIYGSAWFNNNGKGAADLGTIVKALLEAGYAVVCPNHRSSTDAQWPAQLHDIRAVVRFVRGEARKYHFDPSFVATSGFSSGGHLASTTAVTSGTRQATVGTVDIDLEGTVGNHLGESSAVQAACDWSGPIDLTAMDCGDHMTMGADSPEDVLLKSKLDKEPDKYLSLSATTYVDKNDPPVIIFHGEKDNVVPVCQGRKFFEVLQAAGVKTEATFVPEGGHGMGMYADKNLQKMVRFFNVARGHECQGACANCKHQEPKSLVVEDGGTGANKAVMKEEPYKGPMSTTQQQIESIDWAQAQNADPKSPYYQKIDTRHICVAGMSCGGLQTLFNCADPRITLLMICNSGLFNQQNAYQAVGGMPMPPKEKLADIHCPVLYMLGGKEDIAYENGMDDFHRILHVPAVAINYPVGHGGTYRQPHGGEFTIPALAWLDWQLKGDRQAAKMFLGKKPALLQRKDWTLEKNALMK